jgi:hypothetical protein
MGIADNENNKGKSMKIRLLVACVLMALTLGAGASFAASQGRVFFDVAFEFSAGARTYAAGRYEIEPGTPVQHDITIRNTSSGKAEVFPSTSRLAGRDIDKAELVFDQAAGKMYLSEIHIPGIDGYYISGAKGEHTHKIVEGKK